MEGHDGWRDPREYWAAGVETYFDAAGDGQSPNGADRPITTREAITTYDPDLYALVDETMAYKEHVDWRFKRYVAPAGMSGDRGETKPTLATVTQPTPTPTRPVETWPVQARTGRFEPPMTGVYKARIVPHWFHDNSRFWYRNDLHGGAREFIVVDADAGTRQPAFDHQRLAAALSKAADKHYDAIRLPFDAIEFTGVSKAIHFTVDEVAWQCDLESYECKRPASNPAGGSSTSLNSDRRNELPPRNEVVSLDSAGDQVSSPDADDSPQDQAGPSGHQFRGFGGRGRSVRSPDGKWTAFIKEQNVYLTSEADGQEIQLSKDGKAGLAYGMLQWAPDSSTLVAFRIEPGDNKEVYRIETSPQGAGRAVLHSRPYPLPGDKFAAYELNLFTVADRKQIKPEVDRVDMDEPVLRWNKDGRHFTYMKVDRGHQRLAGRRGRFANGERSQSDRRDHQDLHLDGSCGRLKSQARELPREKR